MSQPGLYYYDDIMLALPQAPIYYGYGRFRTEERQIVPEYKSVLPPRPDEGLTEKPQRTSIMILEDPPVKYTGPIISWDNALSLIYYPPMELLTPEKYYRSGTDTDGTFWILVSPIEFVKFAIKNGDAWLLEQAFIKLTRTDNPVQLAMDATLHVSAAIRIASDFKLASMYTVDIDRKEATTELQKQFADETVLYAKATMQQIFDELKGITFNSGVEPSPSRSIQLMNPPFDIVISLPDEYVPPEVYEEAGREVAFQPTLTPRSYYRPIRVLPSSSIYGDGDGNGEDDESFLEKYGVYAAGGIAAAFGLSQVL